MKSSLLKIYKVVKRIAKWFLCTVGVLAVVLFGIFAYWAYLVDYKPYRGVDFSAELWDRAGKAMSSKDRSLGDVLYGISPRCGMYDDLKKNYLKKGMHITEVEKLLGKSISTRYCANKKIKCLSYGLGTCYANALTISSNDLNVCFDRKNKVIEVGRKELDDEICNDSIIHCMKDTECRCFIQNKINGEECNFTVNRW